MIIKFFKIFQEKNILVQSHIISIIFITIMSSFDGNELMQSNHRIRFSKIISMIISIFDGEAGEEFGGVDSMEQNYRNLFVENSKEDKEPLVKFRGLLLKELNEIIIR